MDFEVHSIFPSVTSLELPFPVIHGIEQNTILSAIVHAFILENCINRRFYNDPRSAGMNHCHLPGPMLGDATFYRFSRKLGDSVVYTEMPASIMPGRKVKLLPPRVQAAISQSFPPILYHQAIFINADYLFIRQSDVSLNPVS